MAMLLSSAVSNSDSGNERAKRRNAARRSAFAHFHLPLRVACRWPAEKMAHMRTRNHLLSGVDEEQDLR